MFRCSFWFCRTFVCGLLGCCLIASGSPASADKGAAGAKAEVKADPQHDAMMAEMMKYANPADQHKALEPLVGTWKAVTKSWMGPGEPQVGEGTCERAWAMGGRYVISKHSGNFMEMPFEGMEITGYDLRSKQYVSTWIDNMGTGIVMSTAGSMDPATKTITIEMPMDDPVSGTKISFKNVTKIVDANTHVFTMLSYRDGKEMKEMEVTYTRVK